MALATRWNYVQKLSLIIILCCVFFSVNANAASFDCKKASTWLEKTVCSNPELSKLDDQLAKAYADALKSLSLEGQKETKQYQKQWLKNIYHINKDKRAYKKEASPIAGGGVSIKKDVSSALKVAYENRIRQLQQSLIKFPDRIFRNVHVDYSRTEKDCDESGEIFLKGELFLEQELTYPQIENPRDENEKLWNNIISKKAIGNFGESDGCQEIYDSYDVGFSNKHLISVKRSHYWFTHGAPAAHGYLAPESISWLLEGKKELETSDLFDDKTDWPNKIAALVVQKLENLEGSSELMNMVTSPNLWELSKDGLGLLSFFNAAGYGDDPIITIDWKTLDPYLSKNGRSLIHE